MKKLLSLLFSVVMAASLLGIPASAAVKATGYTLGDAKAFTLSGDESYTNPVRSTDAADIEALGALLASAGDKVAKPKDAKQAAKIVAEVGTKTRTYNILYVEPGEGPLYINNGSTYRPVHLPFSQLQKKLGVLDRDFYKYENLRAEAVFRDTGETLYSTGTTYSRPTADGMVMDWHADAQPTPLLVCSQPEKDSPTLYLAAFSPRPQSVTYTVTHGDTVWTGTAEEAESYRLPGGGEYKVEISAKFKLDSFEAAVEYGYILQREPFASMTLSGGTNPGEIVVLKVKGDSGKKATVTSDLDSTLRFKPQFFTRDATTQIALVPISYVTAPGKHWFDVTYSGATTRLQVTAADKQWQIQNLTVDSTTAAETIESKNANAEYEKYIAPLRFVADDKLYQTGPFRLPVSDKKVTTQFGMIRYVNGQPTSVRHGALDLAVPRGTSVAATGSGRVLFSGFLQLTGNTVLIEHGYGLKSWYYHMDSRSVKAGDVIDQGKIIGTVGSTGFSTGPHLHFGMSVNNVFVNPYTLINEDLLG